MRRRVLLSAAVSAVAAPLLSPPAQAAVRALPNAHAHNDFEHPRPLFDALERGFTSIEADVWVVGDQLLVGHEPWQLRSARTLQSLYLDPLRRNPSPVNLLVDVKTGAEPGWARLHSVLQGCGDLLTTWSADGTRTPGAVTVVVTGNRAIESMARQAVRSAAVEGRAQDATGPCSAEFMPEIGVDWSTTYRWRGEGPMPAGERAALHGLVAATHRAGRRLRFWATPDEPGPARTAVWSELLAAGVDRLNTDDLDGLAQFLTGQGRR
ncbi:PI-PLC domain-containing protein [Kineococcus sp. SYSU DK003]|uniref:hypothetical protein n=1 Tax=Kineococcus sp. SYSU DK003 TaxID=3383124 RepID=UPI003D7DC4B0